VSKEGCVARRVRSTRCHTVKPKPPGGRAQRNVQRAPSFGLRFPGKVRKLRRKLTASTTLSSHSTVDDRQEQ